MIELLNESYYEARDNISKVEANCLLTMQSRNVPFFLSDENSLDGSDVTSANKQLDRLFERLETAVCKTGQDNILSFNDIILLAEDCVKTIQESFAGCTEKSDPEMCKALQNAAVCLAKISLNGSIELKALEEKLAELNISLVGIKTDLYAEIDKCIKKSEENKANIKGITAKKEQLDNDIKSAQESVRDAERRLQKIYQAKRDVEKWCWVPGYNVYLLVEYENQASSCKQVINRLNTEIHNKRKLQEEYIKLIEDMKKANVIKEELASQTIKMEKYCNTCNSSINTVSGIRLQYNQLSLFFSSAAERMETPSTNPLIILNQLGEIRKDLPELTNQKTPLAKLVKEITSDAAQIIKAIKEPSVRKIITST